MSAVGSSEKGVRQDQDLTSHSKTLLFHRTEPQDEVRVPDNGYRGQRDWQRLCPGRIRPLTSQSKRIGGGERESEGEQGEPRLPRQHSVIQMSFPACWRERENVFVVAPYVPSK
ncbi:unnamed protein product [Lota lota]